MDEPTVKTRKRARSQSFVSTLVQSSAPISPKISNTEVDKQCSYQKKLKLSGDSYERDRVFTISSYCRNLAKTTSTPTAKPLDLQLTSEKVASSAAVMGASITAECTSCGKLMTEFSSLACNHHYCNDCTARFTNSSVQANNAFPLLCCRANFPFSTVVDNVPAPAFDERGKAEDGILHATTSSCTVAVYTPLSPGENMDGIIETCQSCSGASCTYCQGEMAKAKQIEDEPVSERGPNMDGDHDSIPAYQRSKNESVQISRADCQHRSFDRVPTRYGHCEVCRLDNGLYIYIMKCQRCSFTLCKRCCNDV